MEERWLNQGRCRRHQGDIERKGTAKFGNGTEQSGQDQFGNDHTDCSAAHWKLIGSWPIIYGHDEEIFPERQISPVCQTYQRHARRGQPTGQTMAVRATERAESSTAPSGARSTRLWRSISRGVVISRFVNHSPSHASRRGKTRTLRHRFENPPPLRVPWRERNA